MSEQRHSTGDFIMGYKIVTTCTTVELHDLEEKYEGKRQEPHALW